MGQAESPLLGADKGPQDRAKGGAGEAGAAKETE